MKYALHEIKKGAGIHSISLGILGLGYPSKILECSNQL